MSQIRWLTRSGESEILCVRGVCVAASRGIRRIGHGSPAAALRALPAAVKGAVTVACGTLPEGPASTWFAAPVVSRLRAPWFGSGRLLAIARHGDGV